MVTKQDSVDTRKTIKLELIRVSVFMILLLSSLISIPAFAQTTAKDYFDNANQHFLASPDVVEPQNLDLVIRELIKALELDPNYLEARMLLGRAYDQKWMVWERDQSKKQELQRLAKEQYRLAAAQKPEDPKIRYQLALRIIETPKEQIEIFSGIIESNPDFAPARLSLSFLLESNGEIDRAIEELKLYIELAKGKFRLSYREYFRLASMYVKQGQKEKAVVVLNEYISETSPHIAFNQLGQLDLTPFKEAGFTGFVSKVENLKNYRNRSHIDKAYQFLNASNVGDAMNEFEHQIAINPYNANHYRDYAKALQNKGYFREAYAVYEKLLDSDNRVSDKCWYLRNIRLKKEFSDEDRSLANKLKSICDSRITFVD